MHGGLQLDGADNSRMLVDAKTDHEYKDHDVGDEHAHIEQTRITQHPLCPLSLSPKAVCLSRPHRCASQSAQNQHPELAITGVARQLKKEIRELPFGLT